MCRVLNDYRERLRRVETELGRLPGVSGGDRDRLCRSLGELERRLEDVESTLTQDIERRARHRSLPRVLADWTTPRLGVLAQQAPEPLAVPRHYLTTAPPREPPSITLVTPSFQQGRYLERTLFSVLRQNYPNLEYVVQDGDSNDGSKAVLARYATALARWISEPDAGQADALNRGFAGTHGEIMGYLNSDDLLLPGALPYIASFFARHPKVDVVYGHRLIIDKYDRQLGIWVMPRHEDGALNVTDYIPQETLFWRRSAWEAAGGAIDTSFRYAIDWDLLLRMRGAGARMARLPRFLGAFRVHEEQKTSGERMVGSLECDRLRRRVHGRTLSPEELEIGVARYLRRHLVAHSVERIKARMPRRRASVPVLPPGPWSVATTKPHADDRAIDRAGHEQHAHAHG